MDCQEWLHFPPTPPPSPPPPRTSLASDLKDEDTTTRVTKIIRCSTSSKFGLCIEAEVEHPVGFSRAQYCPEDLGLLSGAAEALWDWFVKKGIIWKAREISEALADPTTRDIKFHSADPSLREEERIHLGTFMEGELSDTTPSESEIEKTPRQFYPPSSAGSETEAAPTLATNPVYLGTIDDGNESTQHGGVRLSNDTKYDSRFSLESDGLDNSRVGGSNKGSTSPRSCIGFVSCFTQWCCYAQGNNL